MRILFITHYFQPEPNFFMGLPFAQKLVEMGHEIEVLTGFPNYPGGKIYEGYRVRPIQREVIGGIPVVRVPLYPSHDQSSFKRILCYSTFALSASVIGTLAVKKADVVYVCQGPATVGLPANIIRFLRRMPFVFNIQDIWPESLLSSGMFKNQKALKIVHWWCNYIYKRAAKIVVISPGFKRLLCERGVPDNKIEVINNWCDETNIKSVNKDPKLAASLGMEDKFNIVFAGNIGKGQAMGSVIDAAKIIQETCPKVQFLFFGGGVEVQKLKKKTKDMLLKNVVFHDRRPVTEIGKILSLADVLLVHLKDDPLFKITIPSKTQAYMAVGRPVLVGVGGDATDLVLKAGAGIACQPENPNSIAESVKKLYQMPTEQLDAMGQRGRTFYQQELSFAIATNKYEKIFEAVAKRKK